MSQSGDRHERTLLLVGGPHDGDVVTVACAPGDQIAAPFGRGETIYLVAQSSDTAEFEGFRQR